MSQLHTLPIQFTISLDRINDYISERKDSQLQSEVILSLKSEALSHRRGADMSHRRGADMSHRRGVDMSASTDECSLLSHSQESVIVSQQTMETANTILVNDAIEQLISSGDCDTLGWLLETADTCEYNYPVDQFYGNGNLMDASYEMLVFLLRARYISEQVYLELMDLKSSQTEDQYNDDDIPTGSESDDKDYLPEYSDSSDDEYDLDGKPHPSGDLDGKPHPSIEVDEADESRKKTNARYIFLSRTVGFAVLFGAAAYYVASNWSYLAHLCIIDVAELSVEYFKQ